jgi:hypothetical protein
LADDGTYDYTTFDCYCPDGYDADAEGNYDADGAYCLVDHTDDCDYDEYWMEWTCYAADYCYAASEYYYLVGDTSYCLDDCTYGYDWEGCYYDYDSYIYYCECLAEEAEESEESEWDMFTERPYRCEDPFWCALTPPGSDPNTWLDFEDLGMTEWRYGYFDNEGEAYATCVDAETMIANSKSYRLTEFMYTSLENYFG